MPHAAAFQDETACAMILRALPSPGGTVRSTVFAQSLGEYAGGGGGIAAVMASAVRDTSNWLQLSLREDRHLWIGAVVCLVLAMWVFRRR
jgi:hypothetical protein